MLIIWIQKKRYKTTLFLFILLMMFCSTTVYGDSKRSACLDQTEPYWTHVEQWAWNSICTSDDNTADLDEYISEKLNSDKVTIKKEMDSDSYEDTKTSLQLCKIHIAKLDRIGDVKDKNVSDPDYDLDKTDDVIDKNVLDPDSNGWKERELSSKFLRDILFDDSRVSNIRSFGITIRNANFTGKIRLQNARINFPLRLESSLFDNRVILNYINVKDVLSFDNSYFKQKFSMKSATITGDLSLRMVNFDSVLHTNTNIRDNLDDNVLLTNTNIRNNLDISGAKASGPGGQKKLDMDSITVGDNLAMCGVTDFYEVDLEAANIGGTLYMTGTRVDSLKMNFISINNDLLMRYSAKFNNVGLADARIGGRMSLTGTTLTGELIMNSAIIRKSLLMYNATFKKYVSLKKANIGNELRISCSVFEEFLNMDSIKVASSLHMNQYPKRERIYKGYFTCDEKPEYQNITLANAEIGRHVEITDATVIKLNMISSKINGSLVLTGSNIDVANLQGIKANGSLDINDVTMNSLNLRGAIAETFYMPKNWAEIGKKIELHSFRYQNIKNEINNAWRKDVINGFKGMRYTPQTYAQLANVLHNLGYTNEANRILIAGLDHKLDHSEDLFIKAKLLLSKLFIGYGHGLYFGYFNSLAYAFILVLTGFIAIRYQRRNVIISDEKSRMGDDLFYSIDMLLPNITLKKQHDEVKHDNTYVRYYFYFHIVMGYILTLAFLAGLSGIFSKEGF